MVAFLDGQTTLVHPDILAFEQDDARMSGTIEVALRWHRSSEERVCSFANSQPTPGGGTHMLGLLDGVRDAINAYAQEHGLPTEMDADLDGQRISAGLTAVVSVKLEDAVFEGATRGALGSRVVRACVREAVTEHLGRWLKEHPRQAASLIDRFVHRIQQD